MQTVRTPTITLLQHYSGVCLGAGGGVDDLGAAGEDDGFGAAAAPDALGGAALDGSTQLIEPIVFAPYCTYPVAVGGVCWAVTGTYR